MSEQSTLPQEDITKKQQVVQSLEEDDEFEDFKVDNWANESSNGEQKENALWEEDWDDNDLNDNFSKELKYVLNQDTLMFFGIYLLTYMTPGKSYPNSPLQNKSLLLRMGKKLILYTKLERNKNEMIYN
ncbi:hypothetical protein WICPIJ_000155 [Wickerhamomyces pijperi]|uniref:26S proteasome complex subunit SEM1 n=1 Tax=Wickerhamomyces pijperi TaxID=599730 RepID=A0A9P8TSD3_WICPI|nr:hypothetical protein WICPIJ_000155 [Wickerhamomyces pijperi]